VGKRIDDLPLDDTPISVAPSAESTDVRDADWYRFSTDIDDLLATGEYTWAEPTLTDIQATVEKTRRVTEGQRRAIANIEAARHGSRSRRRYEGYGWRQR
jgi:hypothetical protein